MNKQITRWTKRKLTNKLVNKQTNKGTKLKNMGRDMNKWLNKLTTDWWMDGTEQQIEYIQLEIDRYINRLIPQNFFELCLKLWHV